MQKWTLLEVVQQVDASYFFVGGKFGGNMLVRSGKVLYT